MTRRAKLGKAKETPHTAKEESLAPSTSPIACSCTKSESLHAASKLDCGRGMMHCASYASGASLTRTAMLDFSCTETLQSVLCDMDDSAIVSAESIEDGSAIGCSCTQMSNVPSHKKAEAQS